jgi:hypothetical protein
MRDALRPIGYVAGLAVVFAGALGAGSVLGDGGDDDRGSAHAEPAMAGMDAGANHGEAPAAHGLAVAEHGLRLVAPATARAGVRERFAFRVVDEHGADVRDFDVEHTKRLHFIAVRRDLTGFQHLHPEQDASGAWHTDLTLRDPGAYRVFADFTPSGGEATTLASDVLVGGDSTPRPLPAPATRVRVDGFDVALRASGSTLRFAITRGGRPVAVQPYLGASGHLVALRAGDLAYLHVHPHEDDVAFDAEFPSAGAYRLFLQFKVAGAVHTAAFTKVVA